MLHLYDGNNVARRVLARMVPGFDDPVRDLFTQAYSQTGMVVYVWDGTNSLANRRGIYPAYKKQRTETPEDIRANIAFLKELLCHSKTIQIQMDGWEADDVIAHLAYRYKDQMPVHIHSNDADFSQLGLPMDREKFHVDPRYVRLYKALVGDPADNIPGVKGFGKKSWDECDKEALLEWANTGFEMTKFKNKCMVGWRPQSQEWLWSEYDHIQLVRAFWQVVGFIPVQASLVDSSMVAGTPNHQLAFKRLQEFML